MDKNTFLETLREVAEIARTSQEPLGREEIRKYFGDMELSEEQEEMICQYLKLPPEMQTAEPGEEEETDSGEESAADDYEDTSDEEQLHMEKKDSVDQLSDSAYYRMYLDEVREHAVDADEEQLVLYGKLLAGDQSVTEPIVNNWLMRIIEIAKTYQDAPVNMEDLIQEGNMGLVLALGAIPADLTREGVESYLAVSVREAMENYIREVTGTTDRVQAVLGKAALLHEAQELLAKENGQTPSLRQLSEYTHIPAEEVQDILALYEKKE